MFKRKKDRTPSGWIFAPSFAALEIEYAAHEEYAADHPHDYTPWHKVNPLTRAVYRQWAFEQKVAEQ